MPNRTGLWETKARFFPALIFRKGDLAVKTKAVIFDLDGTLLNTLDDLRSALNYALGTQGFPERSLEEVRQFVGNGNWKLVQRGVPQGTGEAQARAVYDAFLPYYQAHSMDTTRPYPGISELLDALKQAGVTMAIVTNKVHTAAVPLCREFFPQVEVVVGSQEGLANKPAPDMVHAAMKTLGVAAGEAVYVGDTGVDVATAQNSGLDCVCVAWGFRTRSEQEAQGGKRFADTPAGLLELLTGE